MRRIVTMIVASACALAPYVAQAQRGFQSTQSANLDPSRLVDANTTEFAVAPYVVWKGLVLSYRSAGIKVTTQDPDAFRMIYIAYPAGRKIGNSKIENVIDCGGGKASPLARTLPLMVTVRSEIFPKGEGATLTTFVEILPIAQPGDSTEAPICSSTFALEKKLQPQVSTGYVAR